MLERTGISKPFRFQTVPIRLMARLCGRLYRVDALPDDSTMRLLSSAHSARFTKRPDPSQTSKVRQVNERAFRTHVYRR
jgi:hypothetical protein